MSCPTRSALRLEPAGATRAVLNKHVARVAALVRDVTHRIARRLVLLHGVVVRGAAHKNTPCEGSGVAIGRVAGHGRVVRMEQINAGAVVVVAFVILDHVVIARGAEKSVCGNAAGIVGAEVTGDLVVVAILFQSNTGSAGHAGGGILVNRIAAGVFEIDAEIGAGNRVPFDRAAGAVFIKNANFKRTAAGHGVIFRLAAGHAECENRCDRLPLKL